MAIEQTKIDELKSITESASNQEDIATIDSKVQELIGTDFSYEITKKDEHGSEVKESKTFGKDSTDVEIINTMVPLLTVDITDQALKNSLRDTLMLTRNKLKELSALQEDDENEVIQEGEDTLSDLSTEVAPEGNLTIADLQGLQNTERKELWTKPNYIVTLQNIIIHAGALFDTSDEYKEQLTDGIYGGRTKAGVLTLQKYLNTAYGAGLVEDGLSGPATLQALLTTQEGETQTRLEKIIAEKPTLNPENPNDKNWVKKNNQQAGLASTDIPPVQAEDEPVVPPAGEGVVGGGGPETDKAKSEAKLDNIESYKDILHTLAGQVILTGSLKEKYKTDSKDIQYRYTSGNNFDVIISGSSAYGMEGGGLKLGIINISSLLSDNNIDKNKLNKLINEMVQKKNIDLESQKEQKNFNSLMSNLSSSKQQDTEDRLSKLITLNLKSEKKEGENDKELAERITKAKAVQSMFANKSVDIDRMRRDYSKNEVIINIDIPGADGNGDKDEARVNIKQNDSTLVGDKGFTDQFIEKVYDALYEKSQN